MNTHHTPIEREFSRQDEHFVTIGAFVRYKPLNTSPRWIDPPSKRTRKNRAQRALERRGRPKKRTDCQRVKFEADIKRTNQERLRLRKRSK